MDGDERLLSPRLRRLAVAGPFLLAAGLVLLFDVLRDIPVSYSCGEDPPAGHDAAVAAYRSGATALHLIAIGWTLGAVALLSVRGRRGSLTIGRPTAVALALAVVATPLPLLAGNGVGAFVILPLLPVLVGYVWIAANLGPQPTALAAALLLLAVARWWTRKAAEAGRTDALRAALWVLALLTAAHLLLVDLQGHGPFVC